MYLQQYNKVYMMRYIQQYNMPDAPYEKTCLYCHKKILMSKETGKWLPYNLNNGPHECRKNETSSKTKQEFTLEAVLKKLESIGIKVNLEELMKNG